MIESDKQYELVDGTWKEVKQPKPYSSADHMGIRKVFTDSKTGKQYELIDDKWVEVPEAVTIKKCPACNSKDLAITATSGVFYCRSCFRMHHERELKHD